MTGAAPIRVLVVDDHDLFRSGLRRLLNAEKHLSVVGEARSGESAVRRTTELRPDVVVMDASMPGISGLEATAAIMAATSGVAVLMLTAADTNHTVVEAFHAGASGYLLKDTPLPEIVRAIETTAAGGSVVAPRMIGALMSRVRNGGSPADAKDGDIDLTEREREVLRLLVAGCDNVEIGTRMHLSLSTIKHHVSNLLVKLGVANRIQAAVFAVRRDLVD